MVHVEAFCDVFSQSVSSIRRGKSSALLSDKACPSCDYMLFVKLFGHTDKPLEETIFSVIWVDNAADGDMEMQNEILES